MSAKKPALPERVRVMKYFETLADDKKVCVHPSDKPMEAPEDKALLQELLDKGLVVPADQPDEGSEDGG